jgi:hypothetical protein
MTADEDALHVDDDDRLDEHLHEHDEDTDHCVCDIELAAGEATADTELPQAVGGVAPDPETQTALTAEAAEDQEDVDGCDVDFTAAEPTRDEELPQAVGGVRWPSR